MASNTLIADINEIHTGFVLNGNKWFDADAKKQFNARLKQVPTDKAQRAIGQADIMAKEFVRWAVSNGYSKTVKRVWWTARPNSMTQAVGVPVDQRKNPSDILIQFTSGPNNGFLGLSAKATKTKGDIGFKNPGVGTVDKALDLKLGQKVKDSIQDVVNKMNLPKSASARKKYIRDNPGIQSHTQVLGVALMEELRDDMFARLKKMKQDELKNYIIGDWMDAEILYPPYIKVTGLGDKPPYKAKVDDPLNNPKLQALSTGKIVLEKIGNESIGVKAGGKKIMKMRFKFESEKMASSMKMSGDPW